LAVGLLYAIKFASQRLQGNLRQGTTSMIERFYKTGTYIYFAQSWYEEYLQYRQTVKPDFDTNKTYVEWASDTNTAESRSSRQSDGTASETSADGIRYIESSKGAADALISVGTGIKSQTVAADDFSDDISVAEQGHITQLMEELDLIIEQDKARTHQQVLNEEQVSEERRRESETRMHECSTDERDRAIIERLRMHDRMCIGATDERARVATEDIYVKGRRRGLPLLLEANGGLQEVMTCYDTGTHDNHMSRAKAIEMGYIINPSPDPKAGFELPNGKIIKAVGYVIVAVQFARQVGSEAAEMTCRFNVFERLALPVLIGMTFLQATETITKYTSRMVDLPTTWKRSLRLCAVGNATNQVACTIDGRRVSAAADTGSEIALVSGAYAMKHGLLRNYSCEELELADGSLKYTSGFADVTVRVSNDRILPLGTKFWEIPRTKRVRFHVLKSLRFDLILDEETIDDLGIFVDGLATIMATASSIMPSLSTIIHLRSVEASLAQTSERVGKRTKELCTSLRSKYTSMFSTTTSSQGATTPGRKTPPVYTIVPFSDKLQQLPRV
jgi:hypothetical protein